MLLVSNLINQMKNAFKNAKEHPMSSIFFLVMFLLLSPMAYSFVLDTILPDSCLQFFSEERCPKHLMVFQDSAIVLSYMFAFMMGLMIYKFLKFMNMSANSWFLFISMLMILTIMGYTAFDILSSNILNSSCSLNIWWLWWPPHYFCWSNNYLLNFFPWVIFWFLWFIWFMLYVSLFSKSMLKTEENIFMSKSIIVSYLMMMLTPLSLMLLLLIWSSMYYWYLTFKEVWQCWLSTLMYINYFLALLYSYILSNHKWWRMYLFSLMTTLIEMPMAIAMLEYHHFSF